MLTRSKARDILVSVAKHFVYQDDLQTFGKPEHWATPQELIPLIESVGEFHGDCDDFAAMCVHEMRKAGHPARFIFCHCPGGYHLVAECNGWVLDNRYTDVMTKPLLERDGYSWISASGTKPGDSWRAIE